VTVRPPADGNRATECGFDETFADIAARRESF